MTATEVRERRARSRGPGRRAGPAAGRAAAPRPRSSPTTRAEALTRFANSAIHQNVADATTTVRLRLHLDGRTAGGSTTVTDGGRPAGPGRAHRSPPPGSARPTRPGPGLTAAAPPLARRRRLRRGDRRGPPRTSGPTGCATSSRAAGGLETAGYCRTDLHVRRLRQQRRPGRRGPDRRGGDGRHRPPATAPTGWPGWPAAGSPTWTARRSAPARRRRRGPAARPIELPPGRYEVVLEPDGGRRPARQPGALRLQRQGVRRSASRSPSRAPQQFDPAVTHRRRAAGAAAAPAAVRRRGHATRHAGPGRGRRRPPAVTHDRALGRRGRRRVHRPRRRPASRSWGPIAAQPAPRRPAASGDADAGRPADGPTAASARALVAGMRRGLLITDFWYTRVLDQKSLVDHRA